MPTLRPFRDYDEHDVVNLFKYSGTIPVNKGTVVKIMGNGWKSTDETELLGDVGSAYNNTVSERYGVAAAVADCGASDTPLGILLHDVKETDENGEKLIFNPRKAAEMQVSLSGQAVPVATKGVFLYSGATLGAQSPAGGTALYTAANGEITTGSAGTKIGTALGAKDSDNVVLIKLEL
tara:strand:+ start:2140 stop:2676 length:537 start_codon:yes stop_codon:yes gene_type:complete